MSDDLRNLAADLAYAAGAGSARLASRTARAGASEAEAGVSLPAAPGPALQSLLARHSGTASQSATADAGAASAAASTAASQMADDAADLVAKGH